MVSVHNSHFYLEVMAEMRAHLAAGTFAEYRRQFIARYVPTQKILAARRAAAEERCAGQKGVLSFATRKGVV